MSIQTIIRIQGASVGLACSLLVSGVHAADNPGAHVHGEVEIDFAIEGAKMAMWLVSPAVNLVGFERSPESAEEEQAVAEAIATLKDLDRVIVMPDSLGCQIVESKAELVVGEAGHEEHEEHEEHNEHGEHEEHAEHEEHDEHKKHGEHEEHGEHEDHAKHEEHGHKDEEQHAEFRSEYVIECANFETPTLQVRLFDTFSGIERIEIRGITPDGQIGQTLTPDEPLILLGGS